MLNVTYCLSCINASFHIFFLVALSYLVPYLPKNFAISQPSPSPAKCNNKKVKVDLNPFFLLFLDCRLWSVARSVCLIWSLVCCVAFIVVHLNIHSLKVNLFHVDKKEKQEAKNNILIQRLLLLHTKDKKP